MSNFYIDPDSGNDANIGSIASPWKTVTNGATAARIAPGDVIYIKKSPDPTDMGQTATFTNKNSAVTLNSAVTANITLCNSAWTSDSGSVTTGTSASSYRQGTASSTFVVTGTPTGLVAHLDLGGTFDFSAYNQISFWLRSDTAAISAGKIQLQLCQGTGGATPINDFTVQFQTQTFGWYPVTIDYGGALDSSIQSIALRFLSALGGTGTIYIDNVLACKDPADPDSLTLNSLIGKNADDNLWWAIKSINDTGIILDIEPSSVPTTTPRGYSGTSETVQIWKREPFIPVWGSGTNVNTINDDGTAGNFITFTGGWDATFSAQDGVTWFDGGTSFNSVWRQAKNYIVLDSIASVRGLTGIDIVGSPTYVGNIYAVAANNNFKVSAGTTSQLILSGNLFTNQGSQFGVDLQLGNTNIDYAVEVRSMQSTAFRGPTSASGSIQGSGSLSVYNCAGPTTITGPLDFNSIYMQDNTTAGVLTLDSNVAPQIIKSIQAVDNGTYGVSMQGSNNITVYSIETSGHSTGSILFSTAPRGNIKLHNWVYSESQSFTNVFGSFYTNYRLQSHDEDAVPGAHIIRLNGGVIEKDDANAHAPAPTSWQFSPTDTRINTYYPLSLEIPVVAVNAGVLTTINMWVKRSDENELGARLRIIGDSIAGIGSSDIITNATAASGVYEQLSISFTASELGVVRILCEAYITGTSTTESAWFSDLSIT